MRAPDPTDPIATFLGGLRRSLRWRTSWNGAGALALGMGGGTLAFAVMAAASPSRAWGILAALALAGGALVTALGARRVLDETRTEEAIARRVADVDPALGDDLLSAVELSRERARLVEQPVLSLALVDALRVNVAARLAALPPERFAPWRPARATAVKRILGVAAAWALVAMVKPGAISRGLSSLLAARTDPLGTASEPLIADVQLTLEYPPYTGLPPRSIADSSGQVLALPGTEVKIDARALVAAPEAALLVEEEGRAVEARPAESRGGKLHAQLVVRRAGGWRFALGTGRGRLREPEAHRIEVEPDRPPRVELYAPGDPLEVAGTRRIELGYTVEDDYGIGDITLVWRAGDGPEQRRVVAPGPGGGEPATAASSERAATGKWEWDLGELALKPGARVAYHLEAKDNDTVSGPNIGRSRTMHLVVTGPRQRREQSMATQVELLEAAVIQLADRLELKAKEDFELAEPLVGIHNRAEALLVIMARAQQALDADAKSGDAKTQLREMAARLGKLVREEELLFSDLKRRGVGRGHRLDGMNQRQVVELERDVLLLDDLLGKQRLEELLHVGDEMAETRDRLKSLMQQYKRTRSEALKKEIEREMRELERKLAELREKASRLAAELPDQFLNREAMGKNDVGDRLAKMREALEKGDLDAAMAELERLSSSLDSMMASMEGDLSDFRGERFSDEEKQLAEIEDKLRDLEKDERDLMRETEAVRQRMRAEAQKQMRDRVEPFLKRAREKVATIKKHVDQVDKTSLSPYEQEEMQRIRERTAALDRLLEQGDLDEAGEAARLSHAGLKALSDDLREDDLRGWRQARRGLRNAREHVDEGEKLARELQSEIEQTMPRPEELLSPEDAKRLGDLGDQQRATRRRVGELQRELGKRMGSDGKPLPLPRYDEALDGAGGHMEKAESRLKRRNARDAAGEEQQALEKLSKLREEMQQQRRPREQQAGGRMDKEPVRIPGADEYRAPKEFRQDLLEAMKRGAPPEYKDQIKRYYEELVK